jgi:hypothetical protein
MILNDSARIILYDKPITMQKGFDSLLALVFTELQIQLLDNVYVLFVNKDRDRFKMLFFNHGHISIYAMRLATPMIVRFEKNIEFNAESFHHLLTNLRPKKSRNAYKIREN